MTQEQYNNFVTYLESRINEAEMTLANIEDHLGHMEHKLEIHRDRCEWSSYGAALDHMQSRIRERQYWAGILRDCRATLAEAKKHKTE